MQPLRRGTPGYLLPHMLDSLEASEGVDTFAALVTLHDVLAAPEDALHAQLHAQFRALSAEQRAAVSAGCHARRRHAPSPNELFLVAQLTGVIGLREVRSHGSRAVC